MAHNLSCPYCRGWGFRSEAGWFVKCGCSIKENSMDDRTLLERAAKAAGMTVRFDVDCEEWLTPRRDDRPSRRLSDWTIWNPLESDGDALRLAVKLGITIDRTRCYCCVYADWHTAPEDIEIVERFKELDIEHPDGGVVGDVAAATRRAIVRAAAEMAKEKP